MSLEAVFMRAGNLRKVCELKHSSGEVCTIEPYAIFTSSKSRRSFYYYLVSSPEADFQPGWRMEEARYFTEGKMLDGSFTPRPDYDPFDKKTIPFMHYSIPTHDGRQRWMDKPSDDRSGEKLRADF